MKETSGPDLLNIHFEENSKTLLTYRGPFDKYMICSFGEYINDLAFKSKSVKNNFFKIFMELAQNVSLYSLEFKEYTNGSKVGIGSIVLFEEVDKLCLKVGNIVDKNEFGPIIEKCRKINSLNRTELREFKRQEHAKPFSSKGGGNIGLIQVVLTSKSPLNFNLTSIKDNNAFFEVCAKIKCH